QPMADYQVAAAIISLPQPIPNDNLLWRQKLAGNICRNVTLTESYDHLVGESADDTYAPNCLSASGPQPSPRPPGNRDRGFPFPARAIGDCPLMAQSGQTEHVCYLSAFGGKADIA